MTIEDKVIAKIRARREKGLAKYGVGLERNDLTAEQWLTHFQEENMDGSLYAERALEAIVELRELLYAVLYTEITPSGLTAIDFLPEELKAEAIAATPQIITCS